MTSVSVVIPVKNRVEKLREAIISALEIREIGEIVVVDDHSEPALKTETLELAHEEHRVHIVRNHGASGAQHARSLGFEATTRELVLFLDSDDLLIKEGVEAVIAAAATNPEAVLFYGNLKVYGQSTNFLRLRGQQYRRVLKNMSLCPFSGLMVRKSAVDWEQISKDLPAWQDDDFCLTVARSGEIYFVDTHTADYRPSLDSISAGTEKRLHGLEHMVKKWGPDIRNVVGIYCLLIWKMMVYVLTVENTIALRKAKGEKISAIC